MYNRTQNDNGTLNTRCLDCFMTIASAVESREELAAIEERHLCPERVLSELLTRSRELRADLLTDTRFYGNS